ncbi:MAG: ATP-dependent Clp protease adapter ClpS [Gammaproteobacteria bacterium]|nr:MAG: ATP-dependent Clp protease adapter ClpS [Gammaproteobacteria bacterium]
MDVYPIVSNTDDGDLEPDYDGGLAVEEEKPKLKPPKQYKVIVINDDYTPMEFVIEVLMTYFAMDDAKATRVMMSVHTKGKGICGVFSHEIAETKVDQVNEYSRLSQHPLMCTMEET